MGDYNNVFKQLEDTLRKESGCTSELDYTEQSSWLLFLKYLDDKESENRAVSAIQGIPHVPIFNVGYRWSDWAMPADKNREMTGDSLIAFVKQKLFPYLAKLKQTAAPNTIQAKIGEVFSELRCKFESGFSLRSAIQQVHKLSFGGEQNRHELSVLYEDKVKSMGNAGRNGGEYYTPRPLIKAMIQVLDPNIGETVYDPACGSAGFLCEAYTYLRTKQTRTSDLSTLQNRSFYGKEKKSLPYVIAIMNMILHGVQVPNIVRGNTLETPLSDIQPSNQYNIILANPPFGGKENDQIKNNFTYKNSETAYLFLQHFMKSLKPGGRAGIVITNSVLTTNTAKNLRQELLENFNLHTVLQVPDGSFSGAGVQTVVLFFKKGTHTEKIWYYQPDISAYLGKAKKLGKTKPLLDSHFDDFIAKQKSFTCADNAWTVDINDIDKQTYDLAIRNPNAASEKPLATPAEILADIQALDTRSADILNTLQQAI